MIKLQPTITEENDHSLQEMVEAPQETPVDIQGEANVPDIKDSILGEQPVEEG
jgi:hypothetical protein